MHFVRRLRFSRWDVSKKKRENIKVIRKYPSFLKSTQSISFAQNVYTQLFIHGTHFTQLKVVLFNGFVCICINRTEFPCVFSTKLPAAFYSTLNCNESYLMVCILNEVWSNINGKFMTLRNTFKYTIWLFCDHFYYF